MHKMRVRMSLYADGECFRNQLLVGVVSDQVSYIKLCELVVWDTHIAVADETSMSMTRRLLS